MKDTLSAQLKKFCEIIKHDHLLLLSITPKSKLWEDETESGGGLSLPLLDDPTCDVEQTDTADWCIGSAPICRMRHHVRPKKLYL